GLRAQHKLNTPLSRCASPRNNAQLCAASETTPANSKTGSRGGSPFSLSAPILTGFYVWRGDSCDGGSRRGPCVRDSGGASSEPPVPPHLLLRWSSPGITQPLRGKDP